MKDKFLYCRQDLRQTALYEEAYGLYSASRLPGAGVVSDAADISTDGTRIAYSGTIVDQLEGVFPSRICLTDLNTGDTRVVTFGPNTDRLPKFCPVGDQIAFLSDRVKSGDFQLYFLDTLTGSARAAPRVDGWVEYVHWSPDGKRLLLGVAGHGADVAGGHGAVPTERVDQGYPAWMPAIELQEEEYARRSVWVYELGLQQLSRVTPPGINVWEAAWCGNSTIALVSSPRPEEGSWYEAHLSLLNLQSGGMRVLYTPGDQLGCLAGAASGRHLALVDAICSDRCVIAGAVQLIDVASGAAQRLDTVGVDIAHIEWRSERHLLLAGHRGFETVIGIYDIVARLFTETWRSTDLTTAGFYATVAGCGESGDCVLVGEGFQRAPEIAHIRRRRYTTVRSFDRGYIEASKVIGAVDRVTWNAPDGLEIQGWLLRPEARKPYPTILNIHGGPVWQSRPTWLARRAAYHLMLLRRGYSIFFTNPRGSSGLGREFVRHVIGDVGGAETLDHLSGLDHLEREGFVDAAKLGVMGGSHGGFMTSWLITQDARFGAAISVCPVTNWVTQELTSNIPYFSRIFVADRLGNAAGKYFIRSPVMHAHKVKTPTLNICGALDRCTPPGEAVQFHNALRGRGVNSVLVTYPQEGHGVRRFPATIDYAARVVGWFNEQLVLPFDSVADR